MTKDPFVLNIVKNGYKIQTLNSKFHLNPIISRPSLLNKSALQKEIDSLLSINAITKIDPSPNDVVSRIFIVPKKNGKSRLILDLSRLNKFIPKIPFKMEDRTTIASLIEPLDLLASFDLKNAFLSIPLHADSQRLTAFELDGQRYCFLVLPFGLTSSPRIFSKVLKPAIAYLRNLGIKISFYLDDVFVCGPSLEKVEGDLACSLSLLANLGFNINFEKSNLVPSHSLQHLGYIWNSSCMTISLPQDKLSKIKYLSKFCLNNSSSIRDQAALLGNLVSAKNGFLYAPLFYRNFQFNLLDGLHSCSNWDDLWPLSNEARVDLLWWVNVSLSELDPVNLILPRPILTIFCDACSYGWGASLSSGEMVSGVWSSSDMGEHINFLELKAIYLSILHFLHLFKNSSICIKSDNSTSIFYLNKLGGTHSKKLCFLALDIWTLLKSNNISISASHISGIKNCAADYLSRFSHFHEYAISQEAFLILKMIAPFDLTLDAFASKDNKKLPNYASILDDNEATHLNAFSFYWSSGIYLFPPIPLIPKTIQKFMQDEVEFGVLIFPAWHSLSVLPLIEKCLVASPIFIHTSHLLGCLPTRHPFHLMAWIISANSAGKKKFHRISLARFSKVLTKAPLIPITGSGGILLSLLRQKNLSPVFLLQ